MLDPDCLLSVLVRESCDGPDETGYCAMIQRTGRMQLVDGAQSQPATERSVDHGSAERQPTSLMGRPRKHPTQIENRRDGRHGTSLVRGLFLWIPRFWITVKRRILLPQRSVVAYSLRDLRRESI